MRHLKQRYYLITSIMSLLFSTHVQAAPEKSSVDMYRSTQLSAPQIAEKFHDELQSINHFFSDPNNFLNQTAVDQLADHRQRIINTLNKMGKFAFIEISTIRYPGQGFFTTFDLVDAKDKQRLAYFTATPTKTLADPDHLLATWHSYETIVNNKIFTGNKLNKPITYCPAFHCISDYHQPDYQSYYQTFLDKEPKNETALITILQDDKNPTHRKSAAYLLAHTHDIHTLTQALVPAMYDPDGGVRNAAMRVLGAAFAKEIHADFPVEKLLPALDFPLETDRNKALYITESLAHQPRYAAYLRTHAAKLLLASLRMQQPNLHEGAYSTLVAMSGKHFSSTDISAWATWLNQKDPK